AGAVAGGERHQHEPVADDPLWRPVVSLRVTWNVDRVDTRGNAAGAPRGRGARANLCRRVAEPTVPIWPIWRAASARASVPSLRAPSRWSRAGARIIRMRRA